MTFCHLFTSSCNPFCTKQKQNDKVRSWEYCLLKIIFDSSFFLCVSFQLKWQTKIMCHVRSLLAVVDIWYFFAFVPSNKIKIIGRRCNFPYNHKNISIIINVCASGLTPRYTSQNTNNNNFYPFSCMYMCVYTYVRVRTWVSLSRWKNIFFLNETQ